MEYRHRIRKHHWGNFRCPICGDRDVWSARTVLDHMQAKHQSMTEDIECPECKKDISAYEIEEHYPKCVMQNNVCINKGKRMCDLCGKMINFGFMRKHKELVTDNVRRFFVSLPCQIPATYQNYSPCLSRHQLRT